MAIRLILRYQRSDVEAWESGDKALHDTVTYSLEGSNSYGTSGVEFGPRVLKRDSVATVMRQRVERVKWALFKRSLSETRGLVLENRDANASINAYMVYAVFRVLVMWI